MDLPKKCYWSIKDIYAGIFDQIFKKIYEPIKGEAPEHRRDHLIL